MEFTENISAWIKFWFVHDGIGVRGLEYNKPKDPSTKPVIVKLIGKITSIFNCFLINDEILIRLIAVNFSPTLDIRRSESKKLTNLFKQNENCVLFNNNYELFVLVRLKISENRNVNKVFVISRGEQFILSWNNAKCMAYCVTSLIHHENITSYIIYNFFNLFDTLFRK